MFLPESRCTSIPGTTAPLGSRNVPESFSVFDRRNGLDVEQSLASAKTVIIRVDVISARLSMLHLMCFLLLFRRLAVLRYYRIGRVAQILDLPGITSTVGCPGLRVLCEERESEMQAPSGVDHVSTAKSNSACSIAAHPCKKRKDGAPSVGTVHAKIAKGVPPANQIQRWASPHHPRRRKNQ